MTKILLLGLANGTNKGTLALLHSMTDAIKLYIPDAEFSISVPDGIDLDIYTPDLKKVKRIFYPQTSKPFSIINPIFILIECILINLSNRIAYVPIPKKFDIYGYKNCDLIINGGGDNLSGESSVSSVIALVNILYGILLNKRIVLYGESLGYYKNIAINVFANYIYNRTKLIILREELSKEYLDNSQIYGPKIFVTADSAFLLNPISKKDALDLLSCEGIKDFGNPLIGINPSTLITAYRNDPDSKRAKSEIASIFAKVIDDLIENLNATILMVPHVYGPPSSNDDRTAIELIINKANNKTRIKALKKEYSPEELKAIIGLCDLFIGARMHATIAAVSMHVPSIGIAYSHKMHGIIGKMLGQEKYIIDISDLSYENLSYAIKDLWRDREKIKEKLEQNIPLVKEKAMMNGMLVRDVLNP